MDNKIVRIQYAEINNLQNVEHGAFKMPCGIKNDILDHSSDILGIYGQNGSGKTTFMNALLILSSLLSGKRISSEVSNYITKGKEQSSFRFDFIIKDESDEFNIYKVIYEFSISKRYKDEWDEHNEDFIPVYVSSEKIKYASLENGGWTSLRTLIEYDANEKKIFKPNTTLREMTMGKPEVMSELIVAKKIAIKQSTSFLFLSDTQKQIIKHCKMPIYKEIISALFNYGRNNLYVISNRNSGLIAMNIALPFSYRIDKNGTATTANMLLRLDTSTVVPTAVYDIVNKVINVMNTVLMEIIPGLEVQVVNMGKQTMKDGEEGVNIELVSVRNHRKIPLRYESEGIKKIISILHMLIAMYNNPSMTLAIDELDAGVYEYLLGEILKVIHDTGRGQLIFTSHNLRPLETLNKNSILFTTTNPMNRYMRLANVKTNNNLRDVYFHDIILGGQRENIYEPTNSYSISHSFRIAGDVDGE
ncbi:MAG: hypothetical protein K0S04_393 [Herbinix sp.]|jgi:AAA15 family ATPase/GTPase|nr:hypothetical protein [Herbinix sp.]